MRGDWPSLQPAEQQVEPWDPGRVPRWPLAAGVAGAVASYIVLNWSALWAPVTRLFRAFGE